MFYDLLFPSLKVIFTWLSALGWGFLILRILKYSSRTFLETNILSLSVGFAFLGFFLFFDGFVGGWMPIIVWSLLIPGFCLFSFIARQLISQYKSFVTKVIDHFYQMKFFVKCVILFLVALFFLQFIASMAPVANADAMACHVALPKLYAQAGRWVNKPDNIYSNNPLAFQMLYLMDFLIGAASVPGLTHWLFGLLLTASMFLYARERWPNLSIAYSLLPSILIITMPLFSYEAENPMVDLALAHYAFVTFWLASRAWKTENRSTALMAGIIAGMTAAVKITGIAVWLVYGITLLLQKRWHRKIGLLFPFVAGAAIVSFPWFIKAWVLTGNPVWPLFYDLIGGKNWNHALSLDFQNFMTNNYGVGHGIISFLRLPLDLTVHAASFGDGPLGMSVFVLPCILLIFAIRKSMVDLWTAFITYMILWFVVLSQQARFLIPILPIWSMLVLGGVEAFLSDPTERFFNSSKFFNSNLLKTNAALISLPLRIKKGLIFSLTGATIILGGGGSIWYSLQFVPAALRVEDKTSYLRRVFPFYQDIEYMNRQLPKNAKILIGERQVYYLDRDYMLDGSLQGVINYGVIKNSNDLLKRLHQLGITHVCYISYANLKDETPALDDYESWILKLQKDLKKKMKLLYFRRCKVSTRKIQSAPDTLLECSIYKIS